MKMKMKMCVLGLTVNLRPVVPLGVYALICFLHNTMLYGSGGTGSLAVFLNLFLHP